MFANKDDYHGAVDDDDEAPPSRVIRKPMTHIDHTGWLWKKARRPQPGQPFKARWFVLSRDRLLYFKSQQVDTAIAEISLQDATVRVITADTDSLPPPYAPSVQRSQLASTGPHVPTSLFAHLFEIDNKQRTYLLRANSATEFSQWMALLLAACRSCHEDNEAILDAEREMTLLEEDWAEREAARVEKLAVLRATLRDPIACEYFIGWEVDRGREESVLCWLYCEGWKGEKSSERRRDKAREIYDSYVRRGGKKEVRIDESTREDIRTAVESAAAPDDWVDRLQAAMYTLLSNVSFPPFLVSSAFYHACMAAVPVTPVAPSSPSRHHAYAQARSGTLSRERGWGTGTGSFSVGSAGRGRREQERLEDDDIVIVLSDDDDRSRPAASSSAAEDTESAVTAAAVAGDEESIVRVLAAQGGHSGDGQDDGDFAHVRQNSYSEIVGGGRAFGLAGDDEAGSASRSPVLSPRYQPQQPSQPRNRSMSPVHPAPSSAQLQQPPPPALRQQPGQQQQQQQQHQQQQGGLPQGYPQPVPAGQLQPPQQPQQKAGGGFFKRIFYSAPNAAGEQRQSAPVIPGEVQQSPPHPVSRDAAVDKSTADALADFYSSKPLAGAALTTPPRPPSNQPLTAQQRQQQMQQQQQQRLPQQPQQQLRQQQQQQQQQHQQQSPPPAHLQQQQQPAQRQPAPSQLSPAAASAGAAGKPGPSVAHVDFLHGMTPGPGASGPFSSKAPALPPPVSPGHNQQPTPAHSGGTHALVDMFENLTIQGASAPAASAAPAKPSQTAPPPPAAPKPQPEPVVPIPIPAVIPAPAPVQSPAVIPVGADDDDFFGAPAVPIPAFTSAASSSSSSASTVSSAYAAGPGASGSSGAAPAAGQSPDPFAEFYGASQPVSSSQSSAAPQGSLDWAFNVPAASPQPHGAGRAGAVGAGRGAMAGVAMRGGMQPQQQYGGMRGRGGPVMQAGRGGPGMAQPQKKTAGEDVFAAAYREAAQRR